MFVLVAVAISTGLLTAITLMPFGVWIAVIGTPVVASLGALIAGCVVAWQGARYDHRRRKLDAQTGLMVSALRDMTQKAEANSPAPKVTKARLGL